MRATGIVIGVAALLGGGPVVLAQETQPQPLSSQELALHVDSGLVANTGNGPEVVFSAVLPAEGSDWMRVKFDRVLLSGDEADGSHSYLLITSLEDGAWQRMSATHLRQWRYASAYFNGDAVLVELVAQPGTGDNQVVITRVEASAPGGDIDATICFSTDDRQLSSDPRAARSAPVGCSVWLIDDCGHCYLTAGHCQSGTDVILFNVPLSSGSGSYNFPPPEHQYAVDAGSLQGNGGQGVGDDWAYFGTFRNSNTGLTAFEAQGATFVLADTSPPVTGQPIRITGYGTVSSPVSPTWNGAQKTHVGPLVTSSGTTVQYQTDTTGGNSGSVVYDEDSGTAIGIHTHGGCGSGGGQNSGTAIQHPQLQTAMANPTGVCAEGPLTFNFPNGLPEFVSESVTVRVEVGDGESMAQAGTGQFHYADSNGASVVPMTVVGPNVYDAVFPAGVCLDDVSFYFSAEDTLGSRYYSPGGCSEPASGYEALVADSVNVILERNFDNGGAMWTGGVAGDTATTGIWSRGDPSGTAAQPEDDHTPGAGGQCWVTGPSNASLGDNDIDGGFTTLLSAVYDFSSDPNAEVSYWLWYSNNANGVVDDQMQVDMNDGSGWVNVLTLGPSGPGTNGGWIQYRHRVADHVAPTSTVQLRFVASDLGSGSIVEAAVDDFSIREVRCGTVTCAGDIDGDGEVGLDDLLTLLANFGMTGASPEDGDLSGNGTVDLDDLLLLLANFGPCA